VFVHVRVFSREILLVRAGGVDGIRSSKSGESAAAKKAYLYT